LLGTIEVVQRLLDLNKWIKLLSGLIISLIIITIIISFNLSDSLINRHFIITIAMPGAYALMGLVEIVTGVPFMDLSKKWNDLAGWQRGVLGTIIAILSFVIIFYGVVLFVI
jgi:uncharacterized membrane protein YagU involved in acid resistance